MAKNNIASIEVDLTRWTHSRVLLHIKSADPALKANMKAAELFVKCLESEAVDVSSMPEEALMERIRRGEGETLQLKSSLESPTSVAKYLAAFANTNGGTIVFGVARPARVLGVDERSAWRILDRAQALLSPQVDVDVDTIEVEGHKLVAAHVERSASPVAAQGAFFWRTGDRLKPLTAAEIRSRVTAGRTLESALAELSNIAATQTRTIEWLTGKFDKANSWARKLGLAGVGAVAGATAKHLFNVLVA